MPGAPPLARIALLRFLPVPPIPPSGFLKIDHTVSLHGIIRAGQPLALNAQIPASPSNLHKKTRQTSVLVSKITLYFCKDLPITAVC